MGEIHIIDCYSRGDITGEFAGSNTGEYAGGISGYATGYNDGNLYIENTYASGDINHNYAGGLIGDVGFPHGRIEVKYSVYNHNSSKLVGTRDSLSTDRGNSYSLNDIMGKLYTVDGTQKWSTNNWAVNGADKLPILRFQLEERESSLSQPQHHRQPLRAHQAPLRVLHHL